MLRGICRVEIGLACVVCSELFSLVRWWAIFSVDQDKFALGLKRLVEVISAGQRFVGTHLEYVGLMYRNLEVAKVVAESRTRVEDTGYWKVQVPGTGFNL